MKVASECSEAKKTGKDGKKQQNVDDLKNEIQMVHAYS